MIDNQNVLKISEVDFGVVNNSGWAGKKKREYNVYTLFDLAYSVLLGPREIIRGQSFVMFSIFLSQTLLREKGRTGGQHSDRTTPNPTSLIFKHFLASSLFWTDKVTRFFPSSPGWFLPSILSRSGCGTTPEIRRGGFLTLPRASLLHAVNIVIKWISHSARIRTRYL